MIDISNFLELVDGIVNHETELGGTGVYESSKRRGDGPDGSLKTIKMKDVWLISKPQVLNLTKSLKS